MKTLKMNTGLWNVLNFSMYETALALPTSSMEQDIETLEEHDLIPSNVNIWDDVVYNHDKYKQDLAEFGINYILENINKENFPFPIELKNPSIWSPREYNFRGDELEFDMIVPDNYVELLVAELNVDWENIKSKFIENYSSCSGFISFFPIPDVDDTPESFLEQCMASNKIEYAVGMLFNYNDLKLSQDEFEYNWTDESRESEWEYVSSATLDSYIDKGRELNIF